jgi:hypothetical protein
MENVTRAMEKVSVVNRRQVWEVVLEEGAVEEIYSSHSSEEEVLHSCADIYANCKPDSSWEELVRLLYNCVEMVAAKEAKTFLQQNGGWLIHIYYLTSHAYVRGKVSSSILLSLSFYIDLGV